MALQLQIEGRVEPDEVAKLRRELKGLEAELAEAKEDLRKCQGNAAQASRALIVLRRALDPLHDALGLVYGELDAAQSESGVAGNGHAPVKNGGAWEIWARKLGGKQAEFINALLEHGAMTPVQLKVVTHSGGSTVSQTLSKLRGLGLLNKDGGKYSLKGL